VDNKGDQVPYRCIPVIARGPKNDPDYGKESIDNNYNIAKKQYSLVIHKCPNETNDPSDCRDDRIDPIIPEPAETNKAQPGKYEDEDGIDHQNQVEASLPEPRHARSITISQ